MRNLEMAEVGFVAGGLEGSSDPRQLVVRDLVQPEWGSDWVIRYDSGGSWIDTGYSCVSLNANPSDSGFFSNAYREASEWFYRTVDRCVFTEVQLGTGGINITFDCGPK
jgi:hypothetical protein